MPEITAAVLAGAEYFTGWLYGRWRARRPSRRVTQRYQTWDKPWTPGSLAFGAMAFSLAWPLVLLTAAVRVKPPKAPDEIAGEARKLAASVAELREANDDWEREMGRYRDA